MHVGKGGGSKRVVRFICDTAAISRLKTSGQHCATAKRKPTSMRSSALQSYHRRHLLASLPERRTDTMTLWPHTSTRHFSSTELGLFPKPTSSFSRPNKLQQLPLLAPLLYLGLRTHPPNRMRIQWHTALLQLAMVGCRPPSRTQLRRLGTQHVGRWRIHRRPQQHMRPLAGSLWREPPTRQRWRMCHPRPIQRVRRAPPPHERSNAVTDLNPFTAGPSISAPSPQS
jgi:hypothetical protein